MLAEGAPGSPRSVLVQRRAADAQVRERDALGVQQAEDVVVRRDQQRGGVGERHVVGQPLRWHVAVRRDDRQRRGRGIQPARDLSGSRVGGEQAVRVQARHARHVAIAACRRPGVATSCPTPGHRPDQQREWVYDAHGRADACRVSPARGAPGRRARRALGRAGDRLHPVQLAATDVDGKSVCIIVPDGTRTCPLPLLVGAVHAGTARPSVADDHADRSRHPSADERGRASPAPGLRGRPARRRPTPG